MCDEMWSGALIVMGGGVGSEQAGRWGGSLLGSLVVGVGGRRCCVQGGREWQKGQGVEGRGREGRT